MGCLSHCMQDSTPFHSKRTDSAFFPRMGSLRLDSSRLSSTSLVQDGRCGDGVPHRTWVYRMLLGFPFAVPVWMSPHEQPALFLSLRTVFFFKKSERVSRFFSLNPALPGASARGRDKKYSYESSSPAVTQRESRRVLAHLQSRSPRGTIIQYAPKQTHLLKMPALVLYMI